MEDDLNYRLLFIQIPMIQCRWGKICKMMVGLHSKMFTKVRSPYADIVKLVQTFNLQSTYRL